MRLGILKHAPDLRLEVLAQLTLLRRPEQFLIGHAAPKKIREPRRQCVLVHRTRLGGVVRLDLQFAAEQKVWRDQNRLERELHAAFEAFAGRARVMEYTEQSLDFLCGHWPSERTLGEGCDDSASAVV